MGRAHAQPQVGSLQRSSRSLVARDSVVLPLDSAPRVVADRSYPCTHPLSQLLYFLSSHRLPPFSAPLTAGRCNCRSTRCNLVFLALVAPPPPGGHALHSLSRNAERITIAPGTLLTHNGAVRAGAVGIDFDSCFASHRPPLSLIP